MYVYGGKSVRGCAWVWYLILHHLSGVRHQVFRRRQLLCLSLQQQRRLWHAKQWNLRHRHSKHQVSRIICILKQNKIFDWHIYEHSTVIIKDLLFSFVLKRIFLIIRVLVHVVHYGTAAPTTQSTVDVAVFRYVTRKNRAPPFCLWCHINKDSLQRQVRTFMVPHILAHRYFAFEMNLSYMYCTCMYNIDTCVHTNFFSLQFDFCVRYIVQ